MELSAVLEIPVVALVTVHVMDVMELKHLASNALSIITLLEDLVSPVLMEHGKLLEIQHLLASENNVGTGRYDFKSVSWKGGALDRVHEGGISTPLIVHWPKGISARGELRNAPGHVIDIVPTVLEVAGGKPFATWLEESGIKGTTVMLPKRHETGKRHLVSAENQLNFLDRATVVARRRQRRLRAR